MSQSIGRAAKKAYIRIFKDFMLEIVLKGLKILKALKTEILNPTF